MALVSFRYYADGVKTFTMCTMILSAFSRSLLSVLVVGLGAMAFAQEVPRLSPGALPAADRPFGTLREQAAMQQTWLKKRLDPFLPALMRKHAIDTWGV